MSFLFFIKPTTVTVDCFTTDAMVYEMAKIECANKFFPDWWKKVPNTLGDHPHIRRGTLKTCSGFVDLYRNGFILPMWCDLAIDVGPINSNQSSYQFSDYRSAIDYSAADQRIEIFKPSHYEHLKLMSPWFVVCNQDIEWMFLDVVWNSIDLLPYRVLTGILNFKYINSTNINLIVPRYEHPNLFLIKYKTPLVHLVPCTEKKIKLKHYLVDEFELNKKTTKKTLDIKFVNRLKTFKSELKCPIKHN